MRFSCAILVSISFLQPWAQANPPACSLPDPQSCQSFEGLSGSSLTRYIPFPTWWTGPIDDFVPLEGVIQSICVWGLYIDADPEAPQTDCSAQVGPDQFVVHLFSDQDDGPGNQIATRSASAVRTQVAADVGGGCTATVFQFELTLSSPLLGFPTNGEAYWLGVANAVDNPERPQCYWHWAHAPISAPSGNSFSRYFENAVNTTLPRPHDLAFCLDVPVAQGASTIAHHPCCNCDGTCQLTSMAQCRQNGGEWRPSESECAWAFCSPGAPGNDQCAGALHLDHENAITPFTTNCATTDGPNPVPTRKGSFNLDNDLWYFFHNTQTDCRLSYAVNDSAFESFLAIYHDRANADICPCPSDGGPASFLAADADTCMDGSASSSNVFGARNLCLDEPGCYTIRVGGHGGSAGSGILSIDCVTDMSPPPPHYDKSRFITIYPPNQGTCQWPIIAPSAIRVTLTSLHHVDPPYSASPSVPFTAFEGQVRWVGPPAEYSETTSSGIKFLASRLQCDPYYHDWSSIERLHVTGSAVVPSSVYEVQFLSSSCSGNEGSCTDVSSPVVLRTTRWADVEIPYNPPSTTAQPDIGDISFLIDRFGAGFVDSFKARGLLRGLDAFGNINIAPDLSFAHIAACVDAFRGSGYPHQIEPCP